MVIRAATDDGRDVKIALHPILQWILGIAATLITATIIGGTAKLIQLETRVTAIEANRFTVADFEEFRGEFVTVREYDARALAITEQLRRIEDKIDRLDGN